MPIKDAGLAPSTTAQLQETPLFFEPHIGICRVTEQKEIERLKRTNGFEGFIDGLHARKDAGRGLIVDRHEQRGAGGKCRGRVSGWKRHTAYRTTTPEGDQTRQPADAREGDPDKGDGEDQKEGDLQWCHTVHTEHPVHCVTGGSCEGKRGGKDQSPSQPGSPRRTNLPHLAGSVPAV